MPEFIVQYARCSIPSPLNSSSGLSIGDAEVLDAAARPLVVDLDKALLRSDLLIESFFQAIGSDLRNSITLILSSFQSTANLKAAIATHAPLDPETLQYDPSILEMARDAFHAGRAVYLISTNSEKHVEVIARHLGVFTGWIASSATENLSNSAKAGRLAAIFGHKGFDYIDHANAHCPITSDAADRTFQSRNVGAKHPTLSKDSEGHTGSRAKWKTWITLLRVHHYSKNALVFVPLLAAHRFDAASFLSALLALIAFSFCASGTYIVNDLADAKSDRSHPRKKRRPFAAGTLPPLQGIALACLLTLSGSICALMISREFAALIVIYLALTLAYTFSLKRLMLIDVLVLAMLYAGRVVGGALAVHVTLSEWLIAFSLFIFTSLALVKRYTELAVRLDQSLPNPPDRNYRTSDLPIVAALAIASGFNAITVLSLYIASEVVQKLYQHPGLLWLICPILMYWIGRMILIAHRRLMHDDPVVFAMTDGPSQIAAATVLIIFVLAI